MSDSKIDTNTQDEIKTSADLNPKKASINLISTFILILFSVASVALGYYFGSSGQINTPITPSPDQVACTLDAKICPDGTAVGGTGPNCEFEECPDAQISISKDDITKKSYMVSLNVSKRNEDELTKEEINLQNQAIEDAKKEFIFKYSGTLRITGEGLFNNPFLVVFTDEQTVGILKADPIVKSVTEDDLSFPSN